jgi:putative transposase
MTRGSLGDIVHLCLRGRRPDPLMQDADDWQALSTAAQRMLFWCGGLIHGCRCEGPEIRFALQLGRAPLSAAARHVCGSYVANLRRRRGWAGCIFKRYRATLVDGELFLDDLVIWLHRAPKAADADPSQPNSCWTGDSAYVVPRSSAWISTDRTLNLLSKSGAGRSAYVRRKSQPSAEEVVALLTGSGTRQSRHAKTAEFWTDRRPPDIEMIARFVAQYSQVSYTDMRSASRKRAVSRAKMVTAVLASRHGASVAAVARLFGRSRSTLIESADHYRKTQPQLFVHAERAFERYVAGNSRIGALRARQVGTLLDLVPQKMLLQHQRIQAVD